MNRREFLGFAALAPLVTSSPERTNVPGGKALVVLPDSARVYDIRHGEARILVGAEQSGGTWWLGSFLSDPGRKTSLHPELRDESGGSASEVGRLGSAQMRGYQQANDW